MWRVVSGLVVGGSAMGAAYARRRAPPTAGSAGPRRGRRCRWSRGAARRRQSPAGRSRPGAKQGRVPSRACFRRRSPYDREIARLAIPAFGALIAEPVYILSDTAVVGHLGTPQLAGMAVASTILLTLYAVFIFLAYGTTAAVSRLLGAGDRAEAAHQAVQSLWLAGMLGVAVLAAGLVAAEPLVALVGAEGAVRDNALVYLRISLFGVPALLAVLAGTGYLRGLQDTRTPLVVAFSTVVLNLALELVLVYGFDQGI